MSDFTCPFCGSDKLKLETGYVDMLGEPETTFCCLAQKRNQQYVKKNFHPDDAPDEEDISKW